MAMVYFFQSCSWSGCVPITRYVTRSRGLRIGSSQVLPFASRTCMRYSPIGFVIKASAATKRASCNQSIERIRVFLEFLRPEHGHEQVSEQQQGDHAHNKVFHKFLLQLLAEADIQTADHEEQHRDSDIDEISHTCFTLS